MTPFAWRATEVLKQQLIEQEAFVCETDFVIGLHRRLPDNRV